MIFSINEETEEIVASIPNGDLTEQYRCDILGCDNPVCSCGTTYVFFFPLEEGEEGEQTALYRVDFDVITKQLAYDKKDKVPKKDLQFAKSLIAKLTDADFKFLWENYFSYKSKVTREASLESINAQFNHRRIENERLLTVYSDILPYDDQLVFQINDEQWIFMDEYCLVAGCSCTDTTITAIVFPKPDSNATRQYTFKVNYKTDKWEWAEAPPHAIDLQALESEAKERIPDIQEKLRERHQKLKTLYAYYKERHSIAKREVAPPKVKVGRNEPCPCGSGKKYKKCCLRK